MVCKDWRVAGLINRGSQTHAHQNYLKSLLKHKMTQSHPQIFCFSKFEVGPKNSLFYVSRWCCPGDPIVRTTALEWYYPVGYIDTFLEDFISLLILLFSFWSSPKAILILAFLIPMARLRSCFSLCFQLQELIFAFLIVWALNYHIVLSFRSISQTGSLDVS